ncbi:TfoX/Sxy family protein [Lichenicoccus sp.]|uniref:TfoX/Sxy family protein n=1 Tax=Lichenicoccus sp. TaxID=2781899 RepID=UPI003D118403
MKHNPRHLQEMMQRAATPDLPISFRPMFGGIMGHAEGKPFASLSDVGLALKLFGTDHAELLGYEGATALRDEPDKPASKSYVVVPTTMLSDPDALRTWIARGAAGLASKASHRRKASSRS